MFAAVRTRGPKTRKAGTATVPTSAIHINSSVDNSNLSGRRVQSLVDRYGLSASRARLVADLAWGAV